MEYIYGKDENYEDYASGRVIYCGKGIPNFPVRLAIELFGRALSYNEKKEELCVYDPCCGGGYLLTIIGLFYSEQILKIYGSDIDKNVILFARKNAALLTSAGLEKRKKELEDSYKAYGKASHKTASESIKVFQSKVIKDVETKIFVADCMKRLPMIKPDVIITDVPYGNLVNWSRQDNDAIDQMLERLAEISSSGAVLGLCMDKKQKPSSMFWKRIEKQFIGKRKFEIFRRL